MIFFVPLVLFCGRALLLSSFLSSRLIAAVAAPNTIERAVRLNFVGYKAAARAANSDRDVLALLDSHAVSVIAPDKVIEIAGGLDCDLYFISRAGGILAGTIVLAFQARAAGARGGFGSALICSPVTPFAVERSIAVDVVIDDAASFAVGAAGKRHGDHISVNDADAIGLIAGAPTKLIDVTVRNDFERAFVSRSVWIRAGDVVLPGDVRRSSSATVLRTTT